MLLVLRVVAGDIQLLSKLDAKHLPEYLFILDLNPPLFLLNVGILSFSVLSSSPGIAFVAHDGINRPGARLSEPIVQAQLVLLQHYLAHLAMPLTRIMRAHGSAMRFSLLLTLRRQRLSRSLLE